MERIAIWLAHGKKCAYCGGLVQLRDLEIDHILPASLKNEPARLAQLKIELGLPPLFEIDSALNFLPTHRLCNSRKTSRVFRGANARYFLELADGKLDEVERFVSALTLQTARESLLAAAKAAIESGNIDPAELIDAISNVNDISLSTQIVFADGEWDGQGSATEIEKLLDRPVLLGGTKSVDGAEFVNDSGGSMVIRTCREYRAAKAARYYPRTTFAMKMEAFLSATNAVLETASHAQVPSISYLKTPRVGVADLHLLPASILPSISPDGAARVAALGKATLQDLAHSGNISVVDVSSIRLDIEFGGVGMVLRELLRADLDGDGMEELLIQYYIYAVGGTLGVSLIGVLRRLGQEALLEYEPWAPGPRPDDLGCGGEPRDA
jgi:hypothetical protein